ncbi:MAG TPA: hypothetical protein VFH26_06595 [Gemmatimonadales bacterium]|nr:hypothetical protein [Gemmatimonadales bacterium]
MTHTLTLPSVARRALILAGLPLLLAIGSASSASSQTVAADSGAAGPRPRKGPAHFGPIAPAILRDSIGVSGSKLEQYTRRYESHMAATKPARDSLRRALDARRSGPRGDDRSAARDQRGALRQQFQNLAQRDEQFEASVKDLLSQDQQKRLAQWKENQRNMARKRWHHHRHDRGGDESRPRG